MSYSCYESSLSQDPEYSPTDCPILVMHTVLSQRAHWRDWARSLYEATSRKVVVFDARNHGDSPHTPEMSYSHLAEDIRAAMKEFDVEQASFIGHHMGGRAVLEFAFRYPKMVKDLIIIDVSPFAFTASHIPDLYDNIGAMLDVKLMKFTDYPDALDQIEAQLSETIDNPWARNLILANVLQVANVQYRWCLNLKAINENYFHLAFETQSPDEPCFEKPALFIDKGWFSSFDRGSRSKIKKVFTKAQFRTLIHADNQALLLKRKAFLKSVTKFLAQQDTK